MTILGDLTRTPHPKVVLAAATDEVMIEQFESVMEMGPSDSRYLPLRAILLGIFMEPPMAMTAR